MKDYLFKLLENGKSLSLEELVISTLMAVAIGGAIYLSYWISHSGTVYSKKFNVSLVVLTILTQTVMSVIGNNMALSLGMVGALSIVRFRTAIKDSRDTAYIFWAIIAGICCGAGDYVIGGVGSCAVFIVLLALGRIKNDNRILLIIRGSRQKEQKIESLIFKQFNNQAKLKVKNSTQDSIEFIYEISKNMYDKSAKSSNSIVATLYELENIEYVNIVAQNDEII